MVSYVLIGIAIGVLISSLFFIFRSSKQRELIDNQNSLSLKGIIDRDRQIKNLGARLNKLSELNSRYLSFVLKVPSVIQRLNSTLKLQDIVLSVIELVNNIVVTDKVEIYLFDASNNVLKKQTAQNKNQQEQITYALGEDLIGVAAERRFILMREQFKKLYPQQQSNKDSKSELWMAVPIIFKDRLLGVIGIGEIEASHGNESDLLKMIADIAGVALLNQMMLNEAQHWANTDSLTGLNNRNYFHKMAEYHMERALREETVISFFLFDIDNFKHYNDTNGHNAGDKLLIELSQLIRESSRKNSTVARYGGEEFIVMLPGISKEDSFIYAERLREAISQYPFQHREKQPLGFVSISGGVASFPEDGDSIEKVIQQADISLYKAKSAGKNRVFLHGHSNLGSEVISAM
jgi:diguanylate cyclase (GGDEF)-like protein